VPGRFRDGLNAHLRPHPIGVLSAEIVPDTFEARFSAKKRHYLYRISNRRANLALDIGKVWRLPRPLDTDAMHDAAQRLVGKFDFTTFRDTECQAKSPEKTLDQLDVIREGDAVSIVTSARSSCTARCARWWDRWCGSARAAGTPMICRRRSMPAAAPPAAPVARPTDSIWCGWIIRGSISSRHSGARADANPESCAYKFEIPGPREDACPGMTIRSAHLNHLKYRSSTPR